MGCALVGGEALIDFISRDAGKTLSEAEIFEKRIGGSPLNVAVGLSRLGDEVEFLSKVADDPFGKGILDFLKKEGIGTSHMVVDRGGKTALAFVSLADGKPQFTFYGADASYTKLTFDEIDVDTDDVDIFHFGSISMLSSPTSETLMNLFQKLSGRTITSFDPNVRPDLVEDRKSFLDLIGPILKGVDILKLSDEDLEFIWDGDFETFVKAFERKGKLTILTLGERGSVLSWGEEFLKIPASRLEKVVDTTGCGDAYMAGVLHVILEGGLDSKSAVKAAKFGSVVAGIVAGRLGAASSMPTLEEALKIWGGSM